MEVVQEILTYAQGTTMWWGLVLLMLAAAVEYVFPPFPGDSVTLVGAILIPTANWPLLGVFAAVMLGSMVGGAFDWRVGIWFERRRGEGGHRYLSRPKVKERLDEIVEKFDRHGAKFLALNRFLPAFRALFFVAAGMADISLRAVLLWSAVSAAAWNALILGVGYLVGYNLESLVELLEQYTTAVLFVFVGALLVWLVVRWRES